MCSASESRQAGVSPFRCFLGQREEESCKHQASGNNFVSVRNKMNETQEDMNTDFEALYTAYVALLLLRRQHMKGNN